MYNKIRQFLAAYFAVTTLIVAAFVTVMRNKVLEHGLVLLTI